MASYDDLAAELAGGAPPAPAPGEGPNGPLADPTQPAPPPPPQPQATKSYDDLAGDLRASTDQDDDLQRKFTAYRAANATDSPDRAAEVAAYASASGYDPAYVSEHLDDVKKGISDEALAQSLRNRPRTLDLMRKASQPEVMKDDVAALGWLEWAITGQWRWVDSGPNPDVGQDNWQQLQLVTAPAVVRAFRDGMRDQEYVALANKQLMGLASPEDIARANELEKQQNKDYGATSWFGQHLISIVKTLPYWAGNAAVRALGGAVGTGVAAASGVETGPGEAVVAPAGALAGQHVAGAAYDFWEQVGAPLGKGDGQPHLAEDAPSASAPGEPLPYQLLSIEGADLWLAPGVLAPRVEGRRALYLADVLLEMNAAVERGIRVLLLEVDSLGGSARAGLGLYHALRAFCEAGGIVVAFVARDAASNSAIYLLGADHIVASRDAMFGVHGVDGDEVTVESRALMDDLNRAGAAVIASHSLVPEAEAAGWLGRPSGLNSVMAIDAKEAHELGLIDFIDSRENARDLARRLAGGERIPSQRAALLPSPALPDARLLGDLSCRVALALRNRPPVEN